MPGGEEAEARPSRHCFLYPRHPRRHPCHLRSHVANHLQARPPRGRFRWMSLTPSCAPRCSACVEFRSAVSTRLSIRVSAHCSHSMIVLQLIRGCPFALYCYVPLQGCISMLCFSVIYIAFTQCIRRYGLRASLLSDFFNA